MLTVNSILAVTRQQAAYGELDVPPVSRDRAARPRVKATQPDKCSGAT